MRNIEIIEIWFEFEFNSLTEEEIHKGIIIWTIFRNGGKTAGQVICFMKNYAQVIVVAAIILLIDWLIIWKYQSSQPSWVHFALICDLPHEWLRNPKI